MRGQAYKLHKRLSHLRKLASLASLALVYGCDILNTLENVCVAAFSGSNELAELKMLEFVGAEQAQDTEGNLHCVRITTLVGADDVFNDGEESQFGCIGDQWLRGNLIEEGALSELEKVVEEDEEFFLCHVLRKKTLTGGWETQLEQLLDWLIAGKNIEEHLCHVWILHWVAKSDRVGKKIQTLLSELFTLSIWKDSVQNDCVCFGARNKVENNLAQSRASIEGCLRCVIPLLHQV